MMATALPNRSRSKQKEKEKAHNLEEEKGGRDCLLFSKVGDVYLYVDDAEIRQVCYEMVVSKEEWKEGNVRCWRQSRMAM